MTLELCREPGPKPETYPALAEPGSSLNSFNGLTEKNVYVIQLLKLSLVSLTLA